MNFFSPLLLVALPLALQNPVDEALKPLAQLRYTEGKLPSVAADQMLLTYYETRVQVATLIDALANVYASQVDLIDEQETVIATVSRWEVVDTYLLLIRDSAKNAEQIMATARKLENLLAPLSPQSSGPAPDTRLTLNEYRPRALSAVQLVAALQPFKRMISTPPPAGGGSYTSVETIHCVPERNLLFIREDAAKQDEIRRFLERIDIPAQQVDLTCWVIRGKESGESSKSLPRELVDGLAQLAPLPSFEIVSTNLLRATVTEPMQIQSTLSDRSNYHLRLVPSAYDAEHGQLSFSSCSFEYSSRPRESSETTTSGFQSGVTLRAGEYTVLGSVGESPLYVVLRLRPTR
jgi:hypothetical protein